MICDRKVGVAMDFSKGSKLALKWAIDHLLDQGEQLYLIHVKHPQGPESRSLLWSADGSPLIPFGEFRQQEVMRGYEVDLDAEVLDFLESACRKHVSVVAKIYWGDAREKLCAAVSELKLDGIVMGSRGFVPIKRILIGSVANYVMQNAICPVTVVKDPITHHDV